MYHLDLQISLKIVFLHIWYKMFELCCGVGENVYGVAKTEYTQVGFFNKEAKRGQHQYFQILIKTRKELYNCNCVEPLMHYKTDR